MFRPVAEPGIGEPDPGAGMEEVGCFSKLPRWVEYRCTDAADAISRRERVAPSARHETRPERFGPNFCCNKRPRSGLIAAPPPPSCVVKAKGRARSCHALEVPQGKR